MGVTINRPPRDGHMAFVRSPDLISIELLQKGDALPPREPWASMAEHRRLVIPVLRLRFFLAEQGESDTRDRRATDIRDAGSAARSPLP